MENAKSNKKRKADAQVSCGTLSECSNEKANLDVGGTLFVAARSTLTSNSAYFESLLSSRWSAHETADGEASYSENSTIFVDQDPKAFEILLRFMRDGKARLPRDNFDLCERVLLQAEFLGISRFLTKVKATSNRRIAGKTVTAGTDHAAEAAEFDEKYGSLEEAIETGVLPLCFFPPSENLEVIASGGKVFTAQKKMLRRVPYFRKFLKSEPTDYWKERCAICVRPELLAIALEEIAVGRNMRESFQMTCMSEMKNAKHTVDLDLAKLTAKTKMRELGNVYLMLGLFTDDDLEAFVPQLNS